MSKAIHLSEIRSVVRPLSLMLLICVMVLQFIAPAVAAPSKSPAPEHHMTMDHTHIAHSGAAEMDHDMSEMDAHHEGSAHCMTFMCCFHQTSAPFRLTASEVLLPSDRGIEQAMILPSHFHSSKDRPPQYI